METRETSLPGAARPAVPGSQEFRRGAAPLHAAGCSHWEAPPPPPVLAPGSLPEGGMADGRMADYLAAARPLYDGAKRCLGQVAGALLLLQTRGLEGARGRALLAALGGPVAELGERLAALRPPPAATRHHAALCAAQAALAALEGRIARLGALTDPGAPELDEAVARLFDLQRRLLAAAVPAAGLAPVDFASACCSCRPARRT